MASLTATIESATTNIINIAKNIALPCFLSFILLPNEKHKAAGIKSNEIISNILENIVGFSNGCAELTPKNPPPFVPNCFIAIWLAAGPCGITCLVITVPSSNSIGCTNCTSS